MFDFMRFASEWIGCKFFTTSANACLAACKEKKRDEAYSKPLSAATLQTVIDKALPLKTVDPELGEPYQVYPIDVKPYDKDFHATLIEYPFGSSPKEYRNKG